MITKKKLNEKIESLTREIEKLNKIVVTNELKKLRIKEQEYKEQTELLSNIKFRIKNIKMSEDDNQQNSLIITYQLPVITIPLDENGKPKEKNLFFYSVNALNLLSIQDFELLSQKLREAENLTKDKTN